MANTAHELPGMRDQAITLLAEITRAECHFNNLETEYRKLASTWLLAGFGAMGYVAASKDLPLPSGMLIFWIGISVSVGIQLLWVVDLLTYHQLLLANFLEGVKLERSFPDLPQIRVNMLRQGSTGRRVRLFYMGSSTWPVIVGSGAYWLLASEPSIMPGWMVVVLTTGLVCSSAFLMFKSPGRWIGDQIKNLEVGI